MKRESRVATVATPTTTVTSTLPQASSRSPRKRVGGLTGRAKHGRKNGPTARRGRVVQPRGRLAAKRGHQMPAVVATENSPPRGARLAAPRHPPMARNILHLAAISRLVGRYSSVPFLALLHRPRSTYRPFDSHCRTWSSNILCSFIVLAPLCVVPAAAHPHAGVTRSQQF